MKKHICSLIMILTLLSVAACGGGGGGGGGSRSSAPARQIISGVAAAGWPLSGTATIKDSIGNQKTVSIGVSGIYNIDVSSMTAPFVLRADGTVASTEYHIYSGATRTDINGNTNITPLTDLIVSNIAGEAAANYYNTGNFANLTASALDNQQVKLQAVLQPLLLAAGVLAGTTDLLRTFFATDNTGLDAVLDMLNISVDSSTATATITDITNQETVSVNFTTQTYTNTFTNTGNTTQAINDIQELDNWFLTLSDLFTAGLPSSSNTQLLSLFDEAEFLNSGQNLTTFLAGLTTNTSNAGLNFTGLTIIALITLLVLQLLVLSPLERLMRRGDELSITKRLMGFPGEISWRRHSRRYCSLYPRCKTCREQR